MFSPERRRFLAILAGFGAAVVVESQTGIFTKVIPGLVQNFLKTREAYTARRQALASRYLGPKEEQATDWWREFSEEEIQVLSNIPAINRIGERHISTVSPPIQEKARQAGYKLIYQGDPEDSVGRTVVAGERQFVQALDDLGFGIEGGLARGIFKAWIPDPEDLEQKHSLYALLSDPIKNQDFTVHINLLEFNPARPEDKPTWFAVDNLDYGPDYIKTKSQVVGFALLSHRVPDPNDPPDVTVKTPYGNYDKTLHYLLRAEGRELTDLAKPGDYIFCILPTTSQPRAVKRNALGVVELDTLVIRRFGGFPQWQVETEVQR